jgi:hypothetical protein
MQLRTALLLASALSPSIEVDDRHECGANSQDAYTARNQQNRHHSQAQYSYGHQATIHE